MKLYYILFLLFIIGCVDESQKSTINLDVKGLKKGDEVYYDRSAGFKIEIEKETYKIIKEFDVVVVL